MNSNNIIGRDIRDNFFNGNIYEELKNLREAVYVLDILQFPNEYTEDEINWANQKRIELQNLNSEIKKYIQEITVN